ncbi:MAG: Phage portal protein Gp6-like, partial [Phycisphaerales bacterium]|nr:Phage portal protein Gp6-like [Phycisphaerales bacterium]
MRNDLARLNSTNPLLADDGTRLRTAADQLLTTARFRLDRLWAYYRNPMRVEAMIADDAPARPYRQAQEWGLPSRITGHVAGDNVFDASSVPGVARKEVVIENDIGWRVETQVDFLFGRA